MKKLFTILLILAIGFSAFEMLKYYRPIFYGEQFNNERIELKLKPISVDMTNLNDNNDTHQTWQAENFKSTGFYQKHLLFRNWANGIKNEEDIYVILIDSQKKLLSLSYDFDKKEITYSLEDHEIVNGRISMSNDKKEIDAKEAKQILYSLLSELPSQQKKVYELCKLEGYSYKEVSEKLKISETTVNSHIRNANKTLKSRIKHFIQFNLF